MSQHWPDELWSDETAAAVPFIADGLEWPQNAAESFTVMCARCGGAIDNHPTAGCGLTRDELLEVGE